MKGCLNKRGQARGTSASLIATIAGLIILYILFLPPQERANLIGDNSGTTTTTTSSSSTISSVEITNKTIFSASPGKITYQSLDQFEYDLNAFTLMKTTSATIIEKPNNFKIRNGWFDKITKNVTFNIDDLSTTDNALLSFNTERHAGTLTILLNGAEIYSYDITTNSPEPVSLPKNNLRQGLNTLEFSTSNVGLNFWHTNEYSFSDLQISADITDLSRQMNTNTFVISEEQGNNLDKAELKFSPDCKTNSVGLLDITINSRSIYSGIPDCGILNTIAIPPNYLNIGKNTVNFKTEKGSYLVDNINVKTYLKEPVQPTFYFDLDDKYFNTKKEEDTARCGDADGVCPSGCSAYDDPDCCYNEYPHGYFCTVKTDHISDRCTGYVDNKDSCERCPSGYKDKDGNIADMCKETCGDNNDDSCPDGCLAKYDKDCCFSPPGDQYWCETLPTTGEDFICMNELTISTCQNCQSGYKAEGDSFDCSASVDNGQPELKTGINIDVLFKFTDSTSHKEAVLWINGKKTGFDTSESSYRKNINDLLEPGTNSINIQPKTDLDIRQLDVRFE